MLKYLSYYICALYLEHEIFHYIFHTQAIQAMKHRLETVEKPSPEAEDSEEADEDLAMYEQQIRDMSAEMDRVKALLSCPGMGVRRGGDDVYRGGKEIRVGRDLGVWVCDSMQEPIFAHTRIRTHVGRGVHI